jgi:hypothetical protein
MERKTPKYGNGEIYWLEEALKDGKTLFGNFLK